MGVVKSVNPFALSIGMGINCGLAGLTFFGKSILHVVYAQMPFVGSKLTIGRDKRVPSISSTDYLSI